MSPKILLIEDEPSMRLGVSHTLSNAGYEMDAHENATSGLKSLRSNPFDLIITDLRLPDINGMDVLTMAKELQPDVGVIIITAHPQVDSAVSAIKQGAYDYISKPFSNDELLMVVSRFFRFKELKQENVRLKKTIQDKSMLDKFICESPAMKKVMDLVAAIADTDVPVRIHGESGTGKELVTNALFSLSARKNKPFLKINCAAIPENLMESELFGHERGAFTGAVQAQKGKFEVANGGTIFFDEIGDLPLSLQPKLLRVLEDQSVIRIGSANPIHVDVRMIFATGKDLKKMIADGTFREDLFYRINVVPVTLPPLRERSEDIPALISYFQSQYEHKYKKPEIKIPTHVYRCLLKYDYPGNVRELRNIVERAVLLSTGENIHEEALPAAIRESTCKALKAMEEEKLPLEEGIKTYEKQRIVKALVETNGRKIKAAEQLGISRKVLWKKMKDLDIDQTDYGC